MSIHVYFQGKMEDNVIYFHRLLGLWNSVSGMIYGILYVDGIRYSMLGNKL